MGLIGLSLFVMVSCEKSTHTEDSIISEYNMESPTVNNADAQDVLNTLENLQDELLEERGSTVCPVITSTAPKGSFPNVVTIDYGPGCVDKKGRYHSGKIVIEQSDSMHNQGAVRKTTFVNFGIDSIKLKNGMVTVTNESGENGRKFIRKTSGMTITGPKGTLDLQSIHARIQVKGGDTKDKSDDVWKIEGESTGSVSGDIKFSTIIKEPLILKGDCPFIVNGKEEITRNGHKAVVEYGDGTCDRFARGTKENGESFVIVLRPRF